MAAANKRTSAAAIEFVGFQSGFVAHEIWREDRSTDRGEGSFGRALLGREHLGQVAAAKKREMEEARKYVGSFRNPRSALCPAALI